MKKILLCCLAAFSLAAAPQAVVFDFGGVMTTKENRQLVVDFLCRTLNLTDEQFAEANLKKKEALKTGKTDEEFWIEFAAQKKMALPEEWASEFRSVMTQAIGVNAEMYDLVDEMKGKQIPVALLSNIDERLSKLIRQLGLYQPFDPCLLSCEIGYDKPDPGSYAYLLEKLDLSAEDVVFIDDKEENVRAAKEIGIDAIWFQSPQQLKEELKERGLL